MKFLRIHAQAPDGAAMCRRRPPESRLSCWYDCKDCQKAVARDEARGGKLPGDLTPRAKVG